MPVSTPQTRSAHDSSFFGHPRGLATLFFTEMWERFSFYGMRALLILFMTASVTRGGLGFDVVKASAIYGMFTSLVYMLSLPGGWLADRFLGLRRAVLYGGMLIAAGNFCIVVPRLEFFYIGLGLIVAGTGLLKPNVSTIVGGLYAPRDGRRDSGFSIFYMGINLGAFIAPLACGTIGQKIDWHLGFGLAGIGMTAGLIQYALGAKYLGDVGLHPVAPENAGARDRQQRQLILGGSAVAALILIPLVLNFLGIVHITVQQVSGAFGLILLATVLVSFTGLLFFGDWTPVERKRLIAVAVLFVSACLFWSVFEQAAARNDAA